jgi:hypothetical protein
MAFDHLGQQPIVLLQRHLHRLRLALPEPGGTLDIGQQEGHRPRRQLRGVGHALPGRRWTRGSNAERRTRKALAQHYSKIIRQQPLQLPGRAELPVGHRPRRTDAVDHRRQSRLPVRSRMLQVQQHRLTSGQPELILQTRNLHPRTHPAIPLPIDADENLALLQIGPIHALRRMRPGAGLKPHRYQMQPLIARSAAARSSANSSNVEEKKTRTR